MDTPLHFSTIIEISQRLAAREISSLELTDSMLARIERLDPSLRSFVTVTPEHARESAKRADDALARGESRGVLNGVPIAVKDLCDTAGIATSAGMPMRRRHVPDVDATVVARLEAAGAVILGKLAMTEGASGAHHPEVPAPRNPWNLERWAGVSSSGSGVATAAGLCFGSLGSDTAGSIRFPSAACGLTGLKPTYGRVSRAGVFPLAPTLDHIGPMTRSTADAGAILAVMAGHDPRDPTSSHRPVPDLLAGVQADLSGVRVGFDESFATRDVVPAIQTALARTLETLQKLGASVVSMTFPDLSETLTAHAEIMHADVARAHTELGLFPRHAEAYGPHLRGVIEIGLGITGVDYARAEERRLGFRGELSGLFESVDLILCPAMPMTAPPQQLLEDSPSDFREMTDLLRFTAPFDLSGSPTLTLRTGFDDDDMPVASQLIARPFEEALLVRAGCALERSLGDATRFPEDPTQASAR